MLWRAGSEVGGGRYAGWMPTPSDPYDDIPYPDEPWGEPEEMDWVPPEDGTWPVAPAGFAVGEPPLDWGSPAQGAPNSSNGSGTASVPTAAKAAPSRFGTALEALRTVFGYDAFRGDQAAIVEQVIGGGDAVVLMPTGGGKSITYQVPALVREGTGLVISPLIALMHDQVDALRANGVRAAYLNSTQAIDERREVERAYVAGELDLIYVAPERLSSAQTTQLLQRGTLSVIRSDTDAPRSPCSVPDVIGMSSASRSSPSHDCARTSRRCEPRSTAIAASDRGSITRSSRPGPQ